jgi:hypothetical protein
MTTVTGPQPHTQLPLLSKRELHALADGLLEGDPWSIDRCVEFVLAETKGLWHGRARAMMCRRLKHCDFGRTNRRKLVSCILGRLRSGNFSEQFKDQLRLALSLDRPQTLEQCELALHSEVAHVRRYGAWLLKLDRARTVDAA